jgi:progesterone-induced-blocking factor 1
LGCFLFEYFSAENTADAEKMLFSYGYGANIVTSAKRRIQQNVHLTRRILHLEKINTSLRHEIDRERNKAKESTHEVC